MAVVDYGAGEEIFLGLGLIIGLGISMQWIARILKVPGILLLLPVGMIVGPVLGLVRPLEIFGASLFPLVTIGVGLLLLKGGLNSACGTCTCPSAPLCGA